MNLVHPEQCYHSCPFNNGEERLEYWFKLYGQMIEEEAR